MRIESQRASSGSTAPLNRRVNELLPAPLPPSKAVMAPRRIEHETEFTAMVGP